MGAGLDVTVDRTDERTEWGLTHGQIAIIEAIVCVVESGRTDKYDAIATIKGDRGGLSYGRHQASLTSGNLHALVARYCAAPGAALKGELEGYLGDLAAKNTRLNDDSRIKALLRNAGADPVMRNVQDDFFYEVFMVPALKAWKGFGFSSALSAATIYDSYIHGSFERIKKLADAEAGAPTADNERRWTTAYLKARWGWLKHNANPILQNTAIRIEALQSLADAGNWDLKLPFDLARPSSTYPLTAYDLPDRLFGDPVRRLGVSAFGLAKPRKQSGAAPFNARDFFVQRCLAKTGFLPPDKVDGDYGVTTQKAVEAFQAKMGLRKTGIVAAEEFDKLCELAAETDSLTIAERADDEDDLKPIAPAKKTVSSTATTVGGTVAGLGAGAGAIALGEAADAPAPADADEAAEAPASTAVETPAAAQETPPAAPSGADGPAAASSPEATDPAAPAPAAVDMAQPDAAAEAPLTTDAPAGPPEAATVEAPEPVAPAQPPAPKTAPAAEALTQEPSIAIAGYEFARSDIYTAGAAALFIVAISAFIVARRVFDSGAR
jgi:chitosanase